MTVKTLTSSLVWLNSLHPIWLSMITTRLRLVTQQNLKTRKKKATKRKVIFKNIKWLRNVLNQVKARTEIGYGPETRTLKVSTSAETPIPHLVIFTSNLLWLADLDNQHASLNQSLGMRHYLLLFQMDSKKPQKTQPHTTTSTCFTIYRLLSIDFFKSAHLKKVKIFAALPDKTAKQNRSRRAL